MCVCSVSSVVYDSATPWTVACQAAPSMEFPRQEHWSGLPFPSPGIFLAQRLNLLYLLYWQLSSLLLVYPRKPPSHQAAICYYNHT